MSNRFPLENGGVCSQPYPKFIRLKKIAMFCKLGTFRNGFTLVEMLVVMVVAALIVALSFPVFKKVIASNQNTKCQMNLKSLGAACLVYAADNDGYLPPNGSLNDNGTNVTSHVTAWSNQMGAYGLKKPNKLFWCPSEDQAFCLNPGRSSYAIPGVVSPGSRFCGPTALRYTPGPWPRIQQFNYPSRVILIYEFFARHYGNKPGMTTSGGAANLPPPTHNVVFLDGHVGTFKSDVNWMNLEIDWRNGNLGGNASPSDRVHVLAP
jgi:prepilin-type N-terminal cleavage/methylation domain-containing protein/prepilin-type processing-associated H-X9-DG protein